MANPLSYPNVPWISLKEDTASDEWGVTTHPIRKEKPPCANLI